MLYYTPLLSASSLLILVFVICYFASCTNQIEAFSYEIDNLANCRRAQRLFRLATTASVILLAAISAWGGASGPINWATSGLSWSGARGLLARGPDRSASCPPRGVFGEIGGVVRWIKVWPQCWKLEHQHVFFSVESPWYYKVVSQFEIAELVQIRMVYRRYIELVWISCVYKATNITWVGTTFFSGYAYRFIPSRFPVHSIDSPVTVCWVKSSDSIKSH